MSGLRSQRLNTITCVSLKSGIASNRRFFTHQVAAAIAATTTIMTKYLFLALNSMIFSTMVSSLVRVDRSGFPGVGSQRRPEPRLGIDQKIGRSHHLIASLESRQDFVIAVGLPSQFYGTRL